MFSQSYDPPLKRLTAFITNPKVTNNGITNTTSEQKHYNYSIIIPIFLTFKGNK